MTHLARKHKASTRLDLGSLRALRSARDYDAAVHEIDGLLDKHPSRGSTASARLELLSVLVEAYDRAHYPMGESSTPQSIVTFMLEQQDKSRADLVPILGSKSRVSEFLNGKRRLSLAQVAALREFLGIPADLLIDAEKAFTYPAPAVRAAAVVRERAPSEEAEVPAWLKPVIAQVIRAQREYRERLDRRLTEHMRELRDAIAELRRMK